MTIEELFKPKESMKQLFADDKEKKADNLYTHDEVKNVLNEYIKKNCKVEKKFIKLDPYLCNLCNLNFYPPPPHPLTPFL